MDAGADRDVAQDSVESFDFVLFATPPHAVEELARNTAVVPASARADRRLEEIETGEDWEFPGGTTLAAYSNLLELTFGSGVPSRTELVLLAGYRYTGFEIEAPEGMEFGVQHSGATIKLQSSAATRDECHTDTHNVVMAYTNSEGDVTSAYIPSALASGSTLGLSRLEEKMWVEISFPHIVFMRSGQYKLCYNPDGGFTVGDYETKNNLIPVDINVIGVDSGCTANGCMSYEQWHCYAGYRGEASGSCQLDVSENGKAGWTFNPQGISSVSWTAVWDRDSLPSGIFTAAEPVRCANTIFGTSIERDEYHFDADDLPSTAGVPIDRTTPAEFPDPSIRVNDSFTVSACYCPNYDSPTDVDVTPCNDLSEFIQPMGGVHFWMLRMCSVVGWYSCGVGGPGVNGAWMRVMPQQPFVVRLQCPPGGVCVGDSDNALKFIPTLEDSGRYAELGGLEYPSWHFFHRCANEVVETNNFTWVGAPSGGPNSGGTGGTRRDYKAWSERPLVVTKSMGTAFDVCYCDSFCDDPRNFFKVGIIETTSQAGIAKLSWEDTNDGGLQPMKTIEFTYVPGSITLYGGDETPLSEEGKPFDFVPFARSGLLKLISFDREATYLAAGSSAPVTVEEGLGLDRVQDPDAQVALDAQCASSVYDASLITGPSAAQLAKDFMAIIPDGESSKYFAFDGENNDRELTALKTGTLSICYCAVFDSLNLCAEPQYWIHVAKLMIRGPRGDVVQNLPTRFVVRLELDGWGFDPSDKLRLVDEVQSCAEDDFNPQGVTSYKLACPGLNRTGCVKPDEYEQLDVVVDNAWSTGVFIESIIIGELNSTLIFTGPVHTWLRGGDTITINESSILLGGKHDSEWSAAERHLVSALSGIVAYPDAATDTRYLPVRVSYVYENSGALDASKLAVPIGWPQGEMPVITFVDGEGLWQRRNRLQSNEEFLVSSPGTYKICWGVSVDDEIKFYGEAGWAAFSEPPSMADAGVHLTARAFGAKAPVVISFSPVYDKAEYSSVEFPTVLRLLFHDVDKLLEPLLATPPGEVLLAKPLGEFDDLGSAEATQVVCGELFLEMWSNHDEGFPMPRGCYYSQKYMDGDVVAQQAAGTTTSNDNTPGARYREFFVVWEAKQGLRSRCYDYRRGQWTNCVYQLVLNAQLMDGWVYPDSQNQDLVSIYTGCERSEDGSNPCGDRYQLFEYGSGRASAVALSKDAAIPTLGDVYITAYGELENATGTFHDWELVPDYLEDLTARRMFGIDIQAFPRDVEKPIDHRMYFRLFFFPLTMWELSTSTVAQCQADCIPPPGKDCLTMGATLGCEIRPTVQTPFDSTVLMPRNMIRMRYPLSMDILSSTTTEGLNATEGEAHILRISELLLPDQGFFSQPFLGELSDDYDTNPSHVLTSQFMYHVPVSGMTSARLLMSGQTGNGENPFVKDVGNELVIRLAIGASMHHYEWVPDRLTDGAENGTSSEEMEALQSPPMFQIIAPYGYEMTIVGDGEADPDGELEWFQLDQNDDGFLDHYMGTPRSLGTWSSSGRRATFTFAGGAALFTGQTIYTKVSLNNPDFELFRDDPSNVWYFEYRGPYNMSLEGPIAFLRLDEEDDYPGWVGNVAVISRLRDVSMQPSSYIPGDVNDLFIFFSPTYTMAWSSFVVIDAPYGFDFGQECFVSNLSDAYYADWEGLAWGEEPTDMTALTKKLPGGVTSCVGDRWGRSIFGDAPQSNFTRARVQVRQNLQSGGVYGFDLQVRNAYTYEPEQHYAWKMWIESPEGYSVDGTKNSILFNLERVDTLPASPYDNSWALYSQSIRDLGVSFQAASLLPTSITIMKSQATFYPIQVSFDGFLLDMRVTAPPGWIWEVSNDGDYVDHVPGVTCEFNCYLYTTPTIHVDNELVFSQIVLRRFESYGFQINMRVPERPPTRFSNYFFVEVGYTGDEELYRLQAGRAIPPALRVIFNAYVFSLCNIKDYSANTLEFYLTTVSEVGINGGFVIHGDSNTEYTQIHCDPTQAAGTIPLADGWECQSFLDFPSSLPVIILSAHESPFPPGTYGFRFTNVLNVPARQFVRGIWSLGTYIDVHVYPDIKTIDQAAPAPAPLMLNEIQYASSLDMPEYTATIFHRDDRPSALNGLIFYFRLRYRQAFPDTEPAVTIAIRAPHGFKFEHDCSFHLQVLDTANASTVSNPWPCSRHGDPLPSWCPDFIDAWPPEHPPLKCLGLGNTAKVSVPNVIWEPDITYGFLLHVTNPEDGEEDLEWAMDFGSEGSVPFSSFKIHTFVVESSSLHAIPTVVALPGTQTFPTLVTVYFTPTLTVPGPLADDATARGFIVLQAPTGFTFASMAGSVCDGTELQNAGAQEADLNAVFKISSSSSLADAICVVADTEEAEANSMHVELVGSKPILAGTQYRLTAFLRHPETPQPELPWMLMSYKTHLETLQTIPLDRVRFPGYIISKSLQAFTVDNGSGEHGGLSTVKIVQVVIRFTGMVRTGDAILVYSPPGLLMGNDDGTTCLDFRWPDAARPFPYTGDPSCSCPDYTSSGCLLRFDVHEPAAREGIVLEAGASIAFNISVVNPVSTPDLVDNYWLAEHREVDGSFSFLATTGWHVFAQIPNVLLDTVGSTIRAGSTGDLMLAFTPQAWGSILDLTLLEPPGFDLSSAVVDAGFTPDARTTGNRLVFSNADFPAGVESSVLIKAVRMGDIGGPVAVHLRLFKDTQMRDEDKTAQRLYVRDGIFQLPGSLDVLDQRLWSTTAVQHYEQGAYDAVKPVMPPHAFDLARVELVFVVSISIDVGENLIVQSFSSEEEPNLYEPINSYGYEPRVEQCLHFGGPTGDGQSPWPYDTPTTCNSTAPVLAVPTLLLDMLGTTASGIHFLLDSAGPSGKAINASLVYRLVFWCRPSLDEVKWHVTTDAGGRLPTNTNDKLTDAAFAVAEMPISVYIPGGRSPTGARVFVDFNVRAGAGQADISALEILMPPGFSPAEEPEIIDPHGSYRAVTRLTLTAPQVEQVTSSEGLDFALEVLAPPEAGSDWRWFVVASRSSQGSYRGITSVEGMTGWGEVPGFQVAPLPTSFAYAPLSEFNGWLKVALEVPEAFDSQHVIITAPEAFRLECPSGGDGPWLDGPCQIQGANFRIANQTLSGGGREGGNIIYSFLIGFITAPIDFDALPESIWNFEIQDSRQVTIDAAFGMQGYEFVDIVVRSPTLSWSSPLQAGESSTATVEISFIRRVQARAILISMPEGYKNVILHPNQVKSLNPNFPVALDVEWREYPNVRWIRLLVEPGETAETDFIPAGSFGFQFPVQVALAPPLHAEWYLSLCSSYECEWPMDSQTTVSFPFPNTAPIADPISADVLNTARARRTTLPPLHGSGFVVIPGLLLRTLV